MTVYVDKSRNPFGRMIMCHMIADTEEELHAMATKIGMKREWFQNKGSIAHYDLSLQKRKLAIEAGAQEVDRREFVRITRNMRPLPNKHPETLP